MGIIKTPKRQVERDTVMAWAKTAARAAEDKKAVDIMVLDVAPVLAITDFFVITSASNPRLVRTIADEIEQQLRATGGPDPIRTEGMSEASWVLIDYGDFVVHIFSEEMRRFYEIERMYKDVPVIDWQA